MNPCLRPLAFALSLALAAPAMAQHRPPAAGPTPADSTRLRQWNQDLDFIADRILRLHPRPFTRTTRAAFDSVQSMIRANLASWDDPRRAVETMKWVAMIEDGHTMAIGTLPPLGFSSVLPLFLRPCEDGLFVAAAGPGLENAVGAKVQRVGGLEASEALARVMAIASGDHRYTRLDRVPLFMMMPAVWKALGVTSDGTRLELEIERSGKRERIVAAAGAPPEGWPGRFLDTEPRWPSGWTSARRLVANAVPRCDQRPDDAWWFEVLPGEKVVYARLRAMEFVSGGQMVSEFYDELFAAVDRVRPRALIVDLRHDHGGSNNVADAFVKKIVQRPWLDRPGGVFALIDRGTFSAAMNMAVFLEAQTNVTFVGEPTGGGLNHYGDAPQVTTPALQLMLQVSTIPWLSRFPMDGRPWIAPQIAVPSTFADWSSGRDTGLEAVLDAIEHGTAPERALAESKRSGKSAGVAALAVWRTAHPNPWESSASDDKVRFANLLIDEARWPEAVAFTDVLVARDTTSALAWRLSGSAHLGAGDRERAVACFRRALAINPRAQASRLLLNRLGEKP